MNTPKYFALVITSVIFHSCQIVAFASTLEALQVKVTEWKSENPEDADRVILVESLMVL